MALADLLGINPAETIAIGDNYNDLSMIRAAGTCDEGAVSEVIKKFIFPGYIPLH